MKRTAIIIIIVLALLLGGFGAWKLTRSGTTYSGAPESITIGMESTAVNTLIYLAENRDYFTANGLNITIKDDYPSGAAAVEGMLNGEVDVATAAELIIVRKALIHQQVRAFGSIDMLMHMKLIGRKDRGISEIADLAGKKIGVPLGSAADFELDRFLELHGIKKARIHIVDIQAPRSVDAVVNGEVDAVVAWQPNVMTIVDRLGGKASVWSVQSGQPMFCVLITTDGWAGKHPQAMKRFLTALRQAEDYAFRHGNEAKKIVRHRLNYDDRYIAAIWPEHQFFLSLDQALILAMEDQARWMINNGLTTEQKVPDFLNYVSEDSLKAVKPNAVSIIQ